MRRGRGGEVLTGKRSHRRDRILFPKRRIVQPARDSVSGGPFVRGARPHTDNSYTGRGRGKGGNFSTVTEPPKLVATKEQRHDRTSWRKGFVLDETALHRARKVIARTEEEIYAARGLAFIEPELREGKDEIALAVDQDLPKLVTDKDLRGILHAHTDRSDGVDTLEVMAEATRARGYHYFGVADHSKSAHYAGGLSVDEIDAQHAEIDRLNKRYGKSFRILKGIESDILADGALDYPEKIHFQARLRVLGIKYTN